MTEHTVTDADDGIRLDRWFKRHMPEIPHALLEKSLRKGDVRLGGKKAKANARIAAGQVVGIRDFGLGIRAKKPPIPNPQSPTPEEAKALQRLVLYKDEHIIVINKPPGLAVQGGTGQGHKHLDAMLDGLRFGSDERPRLVHRLDKDTSGCLALARSAKAAGTLAQKFAHRKTEKIYHALVIGLPMPLAGSINLPLSKQERGKDSRMAYEDMQVDEKSGQPALTEYRVLAHCATKLAWVELRPITGRTHQLRVHMAAIGHPIVGDGKYGGTEAFVRGGLGLSEKLHLHAARLIIPDVFGKDIDVKAPLPDHMKKSLKALEIDA